jgi:hypothetical protein
MNTHKKGKYTVLLSCAQWILTLYSSLVQGRQKAQELIRLFLFLLFRRVEQRHVLSFLLGGLRLLLLCGWSRRSWVLLSLLWLYHGFQRYKVAIVSFDSRVGRLVFLGATVGVTGKESILWRGCRMRSIAIASVSTRQSGNLTWTLTHAALDYEVVATVSGDSFDSCVTTLLLTT